MRIKFEGGRGFGKASLLPGDIENARRQARENREDPDKAEKALLEKFREANAKLRAN